MKNDRRFYVYILFRPWNGVPCYVGKGQRDRWQFHEQMGDRHSNIHLRRIIKKAGGELPKVKVRENLTEEEAIETEIAFIKAIGRSDKGKGPLANRTDGGDGTSGYVHTEKSKRHLSRVLSGVSKMSEEGKARVSAAHTGKIVSEETRRKNGEAHRGHRHTIKTKKQIAASLRGRHRYFSPEHRAKISAAKRGKSLTLEHRRKIADAGVGRRHSEETKKKMSEVQRGHPVSVETKKKISETKRRNRAVLLGVEKGPWPLALTQ